MDYNHNYLCLENIIAANTGNPLFIQGREYKGKKIGNVINIIDEFGCVQSVYDIKWLKKYFRSVKGEVDE